MELHSLGKDSSGDTEATHTHGSIGWGCLITPCPAILLLFVHCTLSSGMSLCEGQCIKAQELFGFELLAQISAGRDIIIPALPILT